MNSGNREQGTGNGSAVSGVRSPPFPISRFLCAARARGFTLIEVLAAIALLAIAFAVSLGALGKSAQNAGRSMALSTALERAQSLFAEQGLTGPLKQGTRTGQFDDGMRWTLKVQMLPKPPPSSDAANGASLQQNGVVMAQASAIDLYQIDLAVQYGDDRTLRLSTQRAQAAPPSSQ